MLSFVEISYCLRKPRDHPHSAPPHLKMEALNKQITALQDELDLKVFRPLQKRAFDASSKCCDGSKSSEQFQACLQRAGQETQHAEHAVMQELQAFQGRVQRCMMQCQDRAQTLVESKGVEKAQEVMEKCAENDCAKFYAKELAATGAKLVKQFKP